MFLNIVVRINIMKNKLFDFDNSLREKYKNIIGLDEVGRGCIAGPLVVVGVILNPNFFDDRIKDSKLIKSIELRKELKNLILKNSISYQIEVVNSNIVDQLGPKQASVKGMTKIANGLINDYDLCLTDFEKIKDLEKPQMNLVKGDNTSFTIACASIIAKSTRDDYMEELDNKYPNYLFKNHQGYLTKKHLQLIHQYGPIKEVHRFSYKPIKLILNKSK
ncbi:ribonuclease HII [Malacoplasma penetrans HF-2]|uniref:Ribonuclease n=2 Tax=Malacoplasma penetrans TaxID=28227 RepID=Q8EUA9_MALP2|nr:ribonuclease HII [Malacoplasma penetrans HF-2]